MSLPPLCLNPIVVFPFLPSLSQQVTPRSCLLRPLPTSPASLLTASLAFRCSSSMRASILPRGLCTACPSGPEPCRGLQLFRLGDPPTTPPKSSSFVTGFHRIAFLPFNALLCVCRYGFTESLLDCCFVFPTSPYVLGGLTMFFSCIVSPAPCLAHSRHLITI